MPKQVLELVDLLIRLAYWVVQKKREVDATTAVDKSVESGDQAPIENALNDRAADTHVPTASDFASLQHRPKKDRTKH